jgi:hypothetical protein
MPKEYGIHYRPDVERLGSTPQINQTRPGKWSCMKEIIHNYESSNWSVNN